MRRVTRNGHHQVALTAIAAVRPMKDVIAVRSQARSLYEDGYGYLPSSFACWTTR
jgi:hypothetical protein